MLTVANLLHTDCMVGRERHFHRVVERQNAKGFIVALVILDFNEKLVAFRLDILHCFLLLNLCPYDVPSGHPFRGTSGTRRERGSLGFPVYDIFVAQFTERPHPDFLCVHGLAFLAVHVH